MLKEEDEKWWMYGVFPGSVAECGDTPNEAFLAFRNRYREILFDIAAEEVGGYEQFKTEVERFFYEKDEEEEQRWNAAHKLIREGSVTPEEAFSNLERMAPSLKPPMILLSRLDETQRFDASQNHTDCAAVAA
jgi:hypothetical protein